MQTEFTNNARPPTKLEKDRLDKIFEVAKHVFLDHEHGFERALGMGVIHGDIGPLYVVMIEEILPDGNSRGTHIQWDDLREFEGLLIDQLRVEIIMIGSEDHKDRLKLFLADIDPQNS